MSRQVVTNADRGRHQNEVIGATGRRQYRQTVGPHWSDSEEEGNPIQPPNHGHGHGHGRDLNEYSELPSPPPPYSEQADPVWLNERVNLHPGAGGRADYVTDSSGRRERYVVDGFGHRVPWPFADRENSSYNGEEDPDMMYLESGRVLPRSEWDADHPVASSSDESVDDRHPDTSQSHRGPGPQTRRTRLRYQSSEDDDSDIESLRARSGHRIRPRYSGRSRLVGRGGRSTHGTGERPPHLQLRARRLSDHDQEDSCIDSTDSERSSEAQARYHRVWGSTGISLEMAASTGARR